MTYNEIKQLTTEARYVLHYLERRKGEFYTAESITKGAKMPKEDVGSGLAELLNAGLIEEDKSEGTQSGYSFAFTGKK